MLFDREKDCYSKNSKKHSSITGRLMDIANGMVSTQSCSTLGFAHNTAPHTHTLSDQQYVTQRLPPLFTSDPRLKQEVGTLANKAAAVLAALTDTEESDWPDGGAPLRNTLGNSGILPTLLAGSDHERDAGS